MKVGTDSVILGAWVELGEACTGLDIGTGTGLLSLMMAQRSEKLRVDALELDVAAAKQAGENVAASEYAGRIRVMTGDFRDYFTGDDVHYDLVVCNPPYFSGGPATGSPRAMARQARSLTLEDIMEGSARILAPGGHLDLVLPYERLTDAVVAGEHHGLYLSRMLEIYPTGDSGPKRCCVTFSIYKKSAPETLRLVIEEGGRHCYSEEYRALTRDFYLDF